MIFVCNTVDSDDECEIEPEKKKQKMDNSQCNYRSRFRKMNINTNSGNNGDEDSDVEEWSTETRLEKILTEHPWVDKARVTVVSTIADLRLVFVDFCAIKELKPSFGNGKVARLAGVGSGTCARNLASLLQGMLKMNEKRVELKLEPVTLTVGVKSELATWTKDRFNKTRAQLEGMSDAFKWPSVGEMGITQTEIDAAKPGIQKKIKIMETVAKLRKKKLILLRVSLLTPNRILKFKCHDGSLNYTILPKMR